MRLRTGIFIDLGMLALMGIGGFIYLNLQAPKTQKTQVLSTPSPTILVSVSPTANQTIGRLANPASIYCTKVGGTLVIQKRGDGGEYGLCQFTDNQACEEWTLYRKECPIGGIKTTSYDTTQEKYCAWLGGKTIADSKATCTLPNKTVCKNDLLYNGTCPQS